MSNTTWMKWVMLFTFLFLNLAMSQFCPPPKYIILHALFEDSVHRFSKLCRNFAQPFQCRFLRGMLLQLFAIWPTTAQVSIMSTLIQTKFLMLACNPNIMYLPYLGILGTDFPLRFSWTGWGCIGIHYMYIIGLQVSVWSVVYCEPEFKGVNGWC